MKTTDEVWNAAEPNHMRRRERIELPMDTGLIAEDPRAPVFDPAGASDRAAHNAAVLASIVRFIVDRRLDKSGIIYFPPGRYYLGRLSSRVGMGLVTQSDLVVPEGVTLRFAPGATLVPFNYVVATGTAIVRPTMSITGRPEEDLRVRLEIKGRIEAGIYSIFDAVLEDVENPAVQNRGPDALHEAGIIILTGNDVREVYPEWWGAVVPRALRAMLDTDPMNRRVATAVRRTTMALQETIHVAHTRRQAAWYGSTNDLGFTRPIPIVLMGEYAIDRELQIGERWRDAQSREMLAGMAPDAGHPTQQLGFILRGGRGPAPSGGGSATLRAHSTFVDNGDLVFGVDGRLTPPPDRATPQSASLLGVRSIGGWLIENVTFDAAFNASRCLTVQSPAGGGRQNVGIEGCTFRRALRRLLHLGGEFPAQVVEDLLTGKDTIDTPTWHWKGGQDLLGLRIARCVFDTGDLNGPNGWYARLDYHGVTPDLVETGRPMGTSMGVIERRGLMGVMYRAMNAVLIEVSNCAFSGPAKPMFHAAGGNVSFRGCSFDTKRITPTVRTRFDPAAPEHPEGVDILLDRPPREVGGDSIPEPVCRLKDVVSRSPMLISSFQSYRSGNAPSGAVELIAVSHDPPADGSPCPAIYWAGHTLSFSRLLLIGCRFVRPARGVESDAQAPVLVDLLAWADTSSDRDAVLVTTINALGQTGSLGTNMDEGSSRGHIVDLGTRIVSPMATSLVAVSWGTVSRIGSLAGLDPAAMMGTAREAQRLARILQLVEHYHVLRVPMM